jgi:hypothetical protein
MWHSSWPITGFVTRLTRRVSLVEQKLLTLPDHLSSPPVFSGARISDCIDQYKQFWNCQLNGILLLIFFRIWNFVYVLQAMYPSSFCLSDRYKQQSYSLTHSRQKNFILPRKSLKIPKGQSESVYRRTDNTNKKMMDTLLVRHRQNFKFWKILKVKYH